MKMDVNFKFIESLVLLQYPEIRLRDAMQQISITGEKENAMNDLKKIIED